MMIRNITEKLLEILFQSYSLNLTVKYMQIVNLCSLDNENLMIKTLD